MGLYRERFVHCFCVTEATARLRSLTDYFDARFGTRTRWHGQAGTLSGRVLGLGFCARFQVQPGRVDGELRVSSLAVRMGGRQYLMRKLGEYMDPEVTLSWLQSRAAGPKVGICGA